MILPLLTAASFTPSIWVVTVVQVLGTGAPPQVLPSHAGSRVPIDNAWVEKGCGKRVAV